jgi:hypothetical protein
VSVNCLSFVWSLIKAVSKNIWLSTKQKMLAQKIKELIGRFHVCKPRIDRTKNVVIPVYKNNQEWEWLTTRSYEIKDYANSLALKEETSITSKLLAQNCCGYSISEGIQSYHTTSVKEKKIDPMTKKFTKISLLDRTNRRCRGIAEKSKNHNDKKKCLTQSLEPQKILIWNEFENLGSFRVK